MCLNCESVCFMVRQRVCIGESMYLWVCMIIIIINESYIILRVCYYYNSFRWCAQNWPYVFSPYKYRLSDWLIDWLIDWFIHSFIHRVTEWNKGRVWPRSVCLLYQLHTCPAETVPAVVEPELWSILSRMFTSQWHWNVQSNLSWWRSIHTAQNITIDMYNSYK